MINEAQYNPPQTGPDASFEWVELFNPTADTIQLIGWGIEDNTEYDTIPSLTLHAGGFAVIAATDDFHLNFPDFTGTIVFIEDGDIGRGLSNKGDHLILMDSVGTVIDAISYGDDDTIMSPPCPKVAEGHSLERSPAGGEFVNNSDPTPGYGLALAATPTPTPGPTASATVTPTATPTASPPISPTPQGTTPPPEETAASPGVVLRAILIVAALAFFAIAFLLIRRRRGK